MNQLRQQEEIVLNNRTEIKEYLESRNCIYIVFFTCKVIHTKINVKIADFLLKVTLYFVPDQTFLLPNPDSSKINY